MSERGFLLLQINLLAAYSKRVWNIALTSMVVFYGGTPSLLNLPVSVKLVGIGRPRERAGNENRRMRSSLRETTPASQYESEYCSLRLRKTFLCGNERHKNCCKFEAFPFLNVAIPSSKKKT